MEKKEVLGIFDEFIEQYFKRKKQIETELMIVNNYVDHESYKQRDARKELEFIEMVIKKYISVRTEFDKKFQS